MFLARNPSAFTDEARPHHPRNLHVSARDVYQALACRIWTQGQGIAAGPTVKAGLKSALVFLGQRSNERLNGFRNRTFCIDAGEFERRLKQCFQSALVSLTKSSFARAMVGSYAKSKQARKVRPHLSQHWGEDSNINDSLGFG